MTSKVTDCTVFLYIFITLHPHSVPLPPNITTSVGPMTISISWVPTYEETLCRERAANYTVEFHSTTSSRASTTVTTGTVAHFTGLQPDSQHNCCISANNSRGGSTPNCLLIGTTPGSYIAFMKADCCE